MAEDTKDGEVAIRQNSGTIFSMKRDHVLTQSDNKKEVEDDFRNYEEENSPLDYELSLREENIRLKSRLEQAKEETINLERHVEKYRDELQKEKRFSEKANKTIYNLMSDKSSLEEQLKRQPNSNKRSEDIIRKLEQEIYSLEERLERQRKRYHHEHLLIYDDLKCERRKQFEWKQTYLRSQVSVMAFRRKLQLLEMHLRPEDHTELMKCLEIGLHDDDSDTEQTDDRKDQYRPRSSHTDDNDVRKVYAHEKPRTSHQVYHDKYRGYNESKHHSHHLPTYDRKIQNGHRRSEEKESPLEYQPKVFIVDEQNRYGTSFKIHSPADSAHSISSSRDKSSQRTRITSPSPSSFNQHTSKLWVDTTTNEDRASSSHHKHWHHHSLDNPTPLNDEVIEKGASPATDERHEKEDYKFLELKFDNGLLKTETRPHQSLLHRLVTSTTNTTAANETTISNRTSCRSVPVGTPLEQKKIWCLTCDGEVTDKLCGHSSLVIQEREKEFPCPTCGRIFNNRSHLKRHNMIHSGEKPWACTYCDKRFNRKSHLSRHILTHTGERPFKCPYCGKGFADNSDLKRHKQIHESTPGFVPILPKDTTIESSTSNTPTIINMPEMASSIITTTTNNNKGVFAKKKSEAKFPCSTCGKVFTRKSHLTRHKLTHDQVKLFCDCGRMFRQNAHLQAHLPACKRKRDAVEAKYLASRSSEKSENEETRRSTSNSPEHLHEMEYELGQTSQEINPRGESGHALKNIPPGIPPLIHDPL